MGRLPLINRGVEACPTYTSLERCTRTRRNVGLERGQTALQTEVTTGSTSQAVPTQWIQDTVVTSLRSAMRVRVHFPRSAERACVLGASGRRLGQFDRVLSGDEQLLLLNRAQHTWSAVVSGEAQLSSRAPSPAFQCMRRRGARGNASVQHPVRVRLAAALACWAKPSSFFYVLPRSGSALHSPGCELACANCLPRSPTMT
ncbi:hypothetical protein PSPO01_11947 [Paraphaeosphaeria sporulosa]